MYVTTTPRDLRGVAPLELLGTRGRRTSSSRDTRVCRPVKVLPDKYYSFMASHMFLADFTVVKIPVISSALYSSEQDITPTTKLNRSTYMFVAFIVIHSLYPVSSLQTAIYFFQFIALQVSPFWFLFTRFDLFNL